MQFGKTAVICSALVCVATSCWGWGSSGHAIVGEFAQRRLSPVAAAGVAGILGAGFSFASVSSWADDVRAMEPATTRWHFVNIPMSVAVYDPSRDCVAEASKGDCIVAAIERERAVVGCETAPILQRQRALKFIIHFVGDLHQPLHTILEARGGNDVNVTVVTREGINGNDPFNSSLHSAWDSSLIDKTVWSWGSYLDRLENGNLAADISLSEGTPVEWAEESHALAVRILEHVPGNFVLDDDYRKANLVDLDRQLARGGSRLAALLNASFNLKACP